MPPKGETEYVEALHLSRPLSKAEVAEVRRASRRGEAVKARERDFGRASRLFEQAASKGHADAAHRLSVRAPRGETAAGKPGSA